jgi:hypothetical protein
MVSAFVFYAEDAEGEGWMIYLEYEQLNRENET